MPLESCASDAFRRRMADGLGPGVEKRARVHKVEKQIGAKTRWQ